MLLVHHDLVIGQSIVAVYNNDVLLGVMPLANRYQLWSDIGFCKIAYISVSVKYCELCIIIHDFGHMDQDAEMHISQTAGFALLQLQKPYLHRLSQCLLSLNLFHVYDNLPRIDCPQICIINKQFNCPITFRYL